MGPIYKKFIKSITIITIYKLRSSLFGSSPRQLYHCVSGPRRPWPSGKSCDLLGWCVWFQDDLYEVRGHQGGQRRNCESRENHLWSSSCQGTVFRISIFLCFLTCQRFKSTDRNEKRKEERGKKDNEQEDWIVYSIFILICRKLWVKLEKIIQYMYIFQGIHESGTSLYPCRDMKCYRYQTHVIMIFHNKIKIVLKFKQFQLKY